MGLQQSTQLSMTWWGEGPSGDFYSENMHSATAACLLGDSEGSTRWQNEHALSPVYSIKLSFSLDNKSALALPFSTLFSLLIPFSFPPHPKAPPSSIWSPDSLRWNP